MIKPVMESIRSDIEPQRPVWHWILFSAIGVVLLVLLLGGVVLIYKTAKLWRAHAMVAEAKPYLAKRETVKDGANLLMSAYQLEPHDAIVLRGLAGYEMMMHSKSALSLYQQLLIRPEATHDEKEEAARGFMSFGDLRTAESIIENLMSDNPTSDDYALKGEVLWANHQQQDAVEAIRKAISLDPASRIHQLLLGQILTLMPNPSSKQEGGESLRKLVSGEDPASLEALKTLCQTPGLSSAEGSQLVDQLRAHPLLDDDGRLIAWKMETQFHDKDQVLHAVRDFYLKTSLDRRALAANWLNANGSADLALTLATQKDAPESQELFSVRMDCLAAEHEWQEVDKELGGQKVPLSPTYLNLYRARAAHELGDDTRSAGYWDKARTYAAVQPDMLNEVTNYALKAGFINEAKKTLILETHIPAQALGGYTSLLRLEQLEGTDAEILQTLSQMLNAFPGNTDCLNDWAFMSLLMNQNRSLAIASAQNVVNSSPTLQTYTTLALSYLVQSDPQSALSAYSALPQDWHWDQTPMTCRGIYVAVLAANGKVADAQKLFKTIDLNQIRPAERDFLKRYNLDAAPASP